MELRELADNLGLYHLLKGQSVERAIEPVPATCSHPTVRTSARPMDLPLGDPHRDTPMSSRPQPEPGLTRTEGESIVRHRVHHRIEERTHLSGRRADSPRHCARRGRPHRRNHVRRRKPPMTQHSTRATSVLSSTSRRGRLPKRSWPVRLVLVAALLLAVPFLFHAGSTVHAADNEITGVTRDQPQPGRAGHHLGRSQQGRPGRLPRHLEEVRRPIGPRTRMRTPPWTEATPSPRVRPTR